MKKKNRRCTSLPICGMKYIVVEIWDFWLQNFWVMIIVIVVLAVSRQPKAQMSGSVPREAEEVTVKGVVPLSNRAPVSQPTAGHSITISSLVTLLAKYSPEAECLVSSSSHNGRSVRTCAQIKDTVCVAS